MEMKNKRREFPGVRKKLPYRRRNFPNIFLQQFKNWRIGKKCGLMTTLTSFKSYEFVFVGFKIKFPFQQHII